MHDGRQSGAILMTDHAPARIRCAECGTPVAEVQGGALVIRSIHHGNGHVTVLSWDELRRLLEHAGVTIERNPNMA